MRKKNEKKKYDGVSIFTYTIQTVLHNTLIIRVKEFPSNIILIVMCIFV